MKLGQCIVDTNVPIVANGDNKAVCYECRFKTIDFWNNINNCNIYLFKAKPSK